MAVLTSLDKVHEFIKRLNGLIQEMDGYEWVNWNYFVRQAVYIRLFDNYLKIVSRDGVYVEAEIHHYGGASIRIGSISDCYCGDCNCGE